MRSTAAWPAAEAVKKNTERKEIMANIISDETIEYVGILANLELSD